MRAAQNSNLTLQGFGGADWNSKLKTNNDVSTRCVLIGPNPTPTVYNRGKGFSLFCGLANSLAVGVRDRTTSGEVWAWRPEALPSGACWWVFFVVIETLWEACFCLAKRSSLRSSWQLASQHCLSDCVCVGLLVSSSKFCLWAALPCKCHKCEMSNHSTFAAGPFRVTIDSSCGAVGVLVALNKPGWSCQ